MRKSNKPYLIPHAWILLSDPQVNMMVYVCVSRPGGRWEPFETLASGRGGWSATICSVEPCAARAPPVGRGSAAVESVWDTGQADWGVSVCPESHAPSSKQGLCGPQVSWENATLFASMQNLFSLKIQTQSLSSYPRSWRTDLPKGACSLVSVSIEHEDCPPVGGVRAIVLESNYLLEPCGSGKSRLTHICRVDLK